MNKGTVKLASDAGNLNQSREGEGERDREDSSGKTTHQYLENHGAERLSLPGYPAGQQGFHCNTLRC